MFKYYYTLCSLFLLSITVACVAPVKRIVTLYSMENGNIIKGQIEDAKQTHGYIEMVDQNTGEILRGEYTSIPNDSTKFAYASSHWANSYGFNLNQSRMIYGEGILTGTAGTVIEIIYAVDRRSLHGHGVGRDNKGKNYKIHF